ncbi:MAG: hypothetical protein ACMXYE_03120 [Candidatus Woesearchaeota archaeon]
MKKGVVFTLMTFIIFLFLFNFVQLFQLSVDFERENQDKRFQTIAMQSFLHNIGQVYMQTLGVEHSVFDVTNQTLELRFVGDMRLQGLVSRMNDFEAFLQEDFADKIGAQIQVDFNTSLNISSHNTHIAFLDNVFVFSNEPVSVSQFSGDFFVNSVVQDVSISVPTSGNQSHTRFEFTLRDANAVVQTHAIRFSPVNEVGNITIQTTSGDIVFFLGLHEDFGENTIVMENDSLIEFSLETVSLFYMDTPADVRIFPDGFIDIELASHSYTGPLYLFE